MIIYTIGHSNRNEKDFIQLLQLFSIELLIDVRKFPSSRLFPQFNRGSLENSLVLNNINYNFLGEQLGGFRTDDYKKHVKTEIFQQGFEQLHVLAKGKKSCLMCAETDYLKCHRRFICDQLLKNGFDVKHIIDKNKIINHNISLL
jgi:uncharacterized protein (DUF488 family)